jgi:membrane protein DedA with SNARE-associated domain
VSVLLVIVSLGLAITLMIKPWLLLVVVEWLDGIIAYLWWRNYLLLFAIGFWESIPFFNIAFPWQTFMVLISWFIAKNNFVFTVFIVMLAGVVGDIAAYWLGRYKWNSILRHYGPTFWLSQEWIDKLKAMIKDHGQWALFASKRNSYTRGMLPFIAGTSHVKFGVFLLYNALWAIVYASVIVYLSRLFIGNYEKVVPYVRWIWLAIIGVVVLWYVIKYYKNGRKIG